MLMVAGVAGAASALAWVTTACSSFTADETPSGSEAGADGADGDAGARPPEDGGSESSGPAFCASHADAAACNDFDGTRLYDGWNVMMGDGGTIGTDDTLFVSPPRSMRSTLDGTHNADARLVRPLTVPVKRVRLSFQLRPTKLMLPSGGNMLSVAEIYCGDGAGLNEGTYLFIEGPANGLKVYGGPNTVNSEGLPPLPMDQWTRIVIDARFADTASAATIEIGTNSAVGIPISSTCTMDTIFEAKVGFSTYSGAIADGLFDDVLLEIDPAGP